MDHTEYCIDMAAYRACMSYVVDSYPSPEATRTGRDLLFEGLTPCTCADGPADEQPVAVVELLIEARRMTHGDRMLKRYASRQGWTCDSGDEDERLLDAAVFLAATGRTFADVLRAAS